MTNPCYAERIKTVCEDRRTVEFSSKFAWISFIAFREFLIHVNKFRDYKCAVPYVRYSTGRKIKYFIVVVYIFSIAPSGSKFR